MTKNVCIVSLTSPIWKTKYPPNGFGPEIKTTLSGHLLNWSLDHLTPRALRHSFAKSLLNHDMTMVQVAALVGHKNLSATARYIQSFEQELEEAVEKIGL